MLQRNLFATLLLAALVPAAARAQATSPDTAPAAPAAEEGPALSLADVLARAKAEGGNPNLVVLRENVTQAEANLRRAWATLLPNISVTGSITRNSVASEIPMPVPVGDPDASGIYNNGFRYQTFEIQPLVTKSLVAQASMPLLVMPAYFGIANAKQAVEAAERGSSFAQDELLLGITQAYYSSVATKQIVEVAEKQLEIAIDQEKLANALYRVGEETKVGPLRASVVRTNAEQSLRRARASYEMAKLALVQLAGIQGPFTVVEPPRVAAPEASTEDLLRTGLASRGDLAASRDSAEIADRALTGAWWEFAPVVSANGQWMKSNAGGLAGEDTTWSATLAATFTVYDGGNRYARLREARSQSRAAQAELEAARRQVVNDVQTAAIELDTTRGNALTAREQAKLAEETALLVQAQYEAGAATSLELSDATTQRFAASVAAITEGLNVDMATLRLYRAIGQFNAEQMASR